MNRRRLLQILPLTLLFDRVHAALPDWLLPWGFAEKRLFSGDATTAAGFSFGGHDVVVQIKRAGDARGRFLVTLTNVSNRRSGAPPESTTEEWSRATRASTLGLDWCRMDFAAGDLFPDEAPLWSRRREAEEMWGCVERVIAENARRVGLYNDYLNPKTPAIERNDNLIAEARKQRFI